MAERRCPVTGYFCTCNQPEYRQCLALKHPKPED